MNPFDLPPVAAILELAASALTALGALVTPAGAVVLVTLAVRALLIPVGVSTAKAAQGRRRIAPQLAALQKRYKKNPEKLQKETMALYAAELIALHIHQVGLAGYLAFGGAIFHASEYLAVCSWAAKRKTEGLWALPRAKSFAALGGFILVIGLANWALALWSMWAWAAVTLVVSLLHYGYDGMIWRSSPKRKVALS